MSDEEVITRPPEVRGRSIGTEEVLREGEESLILSMIHHWSIQGMEPNVIIDLVQKNFSQDQMFFAQSSLMKSTLKPGENVPFHRVTGKRPAGKAQAESLFQLVMKLNHEDKLPRFTVSSEDLGRVSSMVNCLTLRDERSVAARMESLELTMRRMQDSMVNLQQVPTRGRSGQGLQVQEPQGGRAPSSASTASPAPLIVVSGDEVPTFAGVAAKAVGLSQKVLRRQELVVTDKGHVKVRGRSPSQKRGNEWMTAGNPKIKKVKKTVRKTEVGTSSVDLSDLGIAAQAGPIQFYIGNTFGTCDEETITNVLIKCAQNIDKDVKFDVLGVELLTKEDNPRSKCWKVVVPHHCREIMERPDMFPPGWRHRRFYGGGGGGGSRSDKRQKVRSTEEMEAEREALQHGIQQRMEEERLLVSHGVTAGAPPIGSATLTV